MDLAHGPSYRKVLVTNSKKFSIDLPRDLLVYKNCHTYRGYNNSFLLNFRVKGKKHDLVLPFKCKHGVNGMSSGQSTSRNKECSG